MITLIIIGCKANVSYPALGFEIPSAIFIGGKVYWEKEIVTNISDIEKIGVVNNCADENCLPIDEYMTSFTSKMYVGKDVYKSGGNVLIKYKNAYHLFTYNDQMELGKKSSINSDDDEINSIIAPDGVKPNYVFENTRYFIRHQANFKVMLSDFKEVGKIIKEASYAYENLEGTGVGDILYVDNLQNRYMLVKHKNDGKLYFYENESYLRG